MKIALTLSGLPRLFPIAAASWGRIIGRYQPDVYIHTWSTGDMLADADHLHQLTWTFSPKSMVIDQPMDIDIRAYPDRHWPCIDVYRSLSMWHSIRNSYQLAKAAGENYDIVIRGRLDWYVRSFEIEPFDGVVLPYDTDKLPLIFQYSGMELHGFNDHFAYGPTKHMDKYIDTVDEIPMLYQHEGVDYCPENFLAASLVKHQVPVMMQHFEHKLIRS